MTATALWTAVVASYPSHVLVELSNLGDPAATTIATATGIDAAQAVIDLWPVYAQTDYDSTSAAHVQVAKIATLTMLAKRTGKTQSAATVEWDQVFGGDGMIARIKETGPRGHTGPVTNSRVRTSRESINGQAVLGWSDRGALPYGVLPSQMRAED
jgi:hypothetical protein